MSLILQDKCNIEIVLSPDKVKIAIVRLKINKIKIVCHSSCRTSAILKYFVPCFKF